jgi:serine/threonine-protein kinase
VTALARSVDARSGASSGYRLLERIGSGATGLVYRAEHVLLEHAVAIKMLRPELVRGPRRNEECARQFLAEASALCSIEHEHVVELLAFERTANGTPWLVMELLDGADLRATQARGSIGLRRSLEVVRQLCEALHAVHAVGLIHRDVKPGNTFISQRNGRDFVTLIDLGIARRADSTLAAPELAETSVLGTPPYIAPEQALGARIDHRLDLYAVGAMLFELVTSRPLFDHADVRSLLRDALLAEPPVPSTLARVPEVVRSDLDALILRCLAKNPNDRPQSAREVGRSVAELGARLEDHGAGLALTRRGPRLALSTKS